MGAGGFTGAVELCPRPRPGGYLGVVFILVEASGDQEDIAGAGGGRRKGECNVHGRGGEENKKRRG